MKKYLRRKAGDKLQALLGKGNVLPNSVLIFFDCSSPEHEKTISQWLNRHKEIFSKTMLIGVDATNKEPKATVYPILGKKDFSWYSFVKPDAVQRVKPDFVPDYLFVLHKKASRAIDEMVQKIPANLKVSHKPALKGTYNLILDCKGDDWGFLLREFDALMPKVELV